PRSGRTYWRIARSCTARAAQAAKTEMAHTASQPLAASAVDATKAPTALPLHTAKPKIVFDLARASGASEFTSVWFATIVARRPQSRSAAPIASATGHQTPNAKTR